MPTLRLPSFLAIRFLLSALFAQIAIFPHSSAHAAFPLPSALQVQQKIDKLPKSGSTEADQAAIKATLDQTLVFLKQAQENQERLTEVKKRLNQAPQRIQEMQQELLRLQKSKTLPIQTQFEKAEITQLEAQQEQRRNQLSDWQKQLNDTNIDIINAQTRPERAQAQISANQARMQQISLELKSSKDSSRPLSADQQEQRSAEQAALDTQSEFLRTELAGNSLLQDLATTRRDLLTERIRRIEQENETLQTLINERRRERSEQTMAELTRTAQNAGSDSLLAKESATNVQLSDYLLSATNRLNELTQQNLRTKQQLDSLAQAEQALDEQIDVLKGSLLLARILYQQQEALPQLQPSEDQPLADEIGDTRLYQFKISQARDKLTNPEADAEALLANHPQEMSAETRAPLIDLLKTRATLYDQINRELNAVLSEAINLQINQKQLQATAKAMRETLDKQLFWIPSNKPLDLDWLKQAPRYLQHQLASLPWATSVRELSYGLGNRPWLFIPLLLLVGILLWRRTWIANKLAALHTAIGRVKRDSQLHTPVAILLNILLALPVTLLLGLAGLALLLDARGQNVALGSALLEMAQAWLVFYTVYRILAPNGVAELHFRWPKEIIAYLHTYVRRLGFVVIALVAVVTVAEHQPSELAEDVIGLVVVLSGFLLMAWLLARLLLSGPLAENATILRKAISLSVVLLPLALSGAIALGYYYTALKLTDRLIETLSLLLIWIVVQGAVERGLAVAARRLAWQIALAKRIANKESSDDEIPLEEPRIDINRVNQQSLRLIRLGLSALLITALYWVWADLLTVFSYLDNITLYEYSNASGDTTTLVPLSLLDLLGSIIVIAITIVLAGNLPGLLEVTVLSRIKLGQGSAYAITTLLSYIIIGTGAATTLSTLGVSWDKLQWLVAALSVGIGFGMQEIFANFISGLIILFERPVRIGDVVTIGDLSGRVSRIRIRATTIIDANRKEIIVPNKTFITSQLINWSLTDTVTRVVIRIGLAYETDLPLARRIMLEVARSNPRVMPEPEPSLFFLNIGASTFDFEMRVHVRELNDRDAVVDELYSAIASRFRENGIDMAFDQLDVMIKNLGSNLALGLTPAASTPAASSSATK
ncbi:MscS Mechanosensitive ion channel precursor [gamma proteobacterium HdN1]|nr:MscS Mechanosensitive ion channel precursor [gamma proteobacterium HdN1]